MIKFLITFFLLIPSLVSAEYIMNASDGRRLHLKEGTFQPDLSLYRSKLPEVKILDRTFKKDQTRRRAFAEERHWMILREIVEK